MSEKLAWKRVLLKLSGEALAGGEPLGIDAAVVGRIAGEIAAAHALGAEIGVVIGGGNLFRGAWLEKQGTDRVTGDHMGMMATVMNALAMREALRARGVEARVLSGLPMPTVAETFTQRGASEAFARDRVVLFAGGLGTPFLTTDTTAAMRASEMRCDAILKATNVDGVYTADPKKDPNATRFDRLTFDEAIRRDLKVLDTAAFALARDNGIPIIVFSAQEPGALIDVLKGTAAATVVAGRDPRGG
ncbi:MAG: UMP kinase [Siculibacillus sp.]|nr:UMP kinase [Siculibacillus sp.]